MAGAAALNPLPHLHTHYGSYDISAHSRSGWSRVEPSPSYQTNVNKGRRKDSDLSASSVHQVYLDPLVRDGLRTPPADDMNSTAYQSQQYRGYGGKHGGIYPSTASFPSSTSRQQLYSANQPSRTSTASAALNIGGKSFSKNYSPQNVSTAVLATAEETPHRKNGILPSLQIPASINNSGGSLGEFAAEITCLFWFETVATLRKAEEWTTASSPVKPLVRDAIPTTSFRKWVVTILSTTQVTQNVILLALLFIYRLKTLNPTVKGKAGSEYRLLTVALMLGNKFLDDNTYTNKTWAEVSGISVTEIHVMEVEFLSNMRYSLLASKDQWKEWQIKLGKFWEYFERAKKAPTLPSPVAVTQSTALPSSPTSIQASPPALSTYPPNSAPYNFNQQWTNFTPPLVSPLPSMPDLIPELNLQSTRKRSYDDAAGEPPAKRSQRVPLHASAPAISGSRQSLPRLPVPNLSVSTAQMNGYPAVSNFQQNLQNLQNLPLLPPLSGRSMSTVYPTTPLWTPHTQATLTPTTSSHSTTQGIGGAAAYGTPSRRHSPRSVQDIISMNSSPISGSFPISSHNLNSPSFFLQQRSSPYRPVRPPNTLLYPPPSGSMYNFSTNIDQMHYQPLGKRNDYRSGVVPEYAANQAYHYQHWPTLPQPNF